MSGFYSLSDSMQFDTIKKMSEECLSHWFNDPCEVVPIKYRENAVFAVLHRDGSRHAMRVHRPNYHTNEELRSELCWMRFLSQAGIDIPVVVAPIRGELPFLVARHDKVPEPRQVDVLTWLEGGALGSIEDQMESDYTRATDLSHEIGRLVGRIHSSSKQWERPPYFTRHSWDEEGLLGERPIWGRFWELPELSAVQKDLLLRCREAALAELARLGKSNDIYGLIHADLVPDNMLIDGKRLKVIDFDDCGFGWYVFELVTCLYFYLDYPHYEQMKERLLAGYSEATGFEAGEAIKTLPLFLMLRSMTYLAWIMTRQNTPTAQALSPMLRERTFRLCEEFLASPCDLR
jgi:Ser/Thr protein kinase RdoA (MazF antagonist)